MDQINRKLQGMIMGFPVSERARERPYLTHKGRVKERGRGRARGGYISSKWPMTMELWAAAAQLLDSFCANHFCCHTITNEKNPIITANAYQN